MIIQIINDNIEEYEEAASLQKPYSIKTLNTRDILNLLLDKKYLSFLQSIRSYIYFRFPIKNHNYQFYLYSKKDFQNFELLFSPGQVVVISQSKLSILQEKLNTAFHNTIDTFISLYIYNLYSLFCRFQYYEKIKSSIFFRKHILRIPDRFLYFIDCFIIKRRLNKNHHSLIKIINSSVYDYFSDLEKNDFNTLIEKNIITLNYLLKFNKRYLLFGYISKKRANTFIASLSILTLLTIIIFYLHYILSNNAIYFLILLFLFIIFLVGYALNNIQR